MVARCRRVFGQRRVGHAGTLDPDATGVLLVGLGRATRLLRFLTALPKTYVAEIVLGTATSTLDASGEVTGTWDMSAVTPAQVAGGGGRPDRRHRAGPADGLGRQDRRTASARAGPPGDRGGAPAPPGHRLPLRHRARPRAPERLPGRRSSARRGPTSAPWPTTWGRPSAGAPTSERCAAPGSARSARTTCGCWTGSTTTPSSPRPRPCATWTTSPCESEFAGAIGHGLALDRVPVGAAGDGPWAMVDDRGTLLAVYEATGTDRIKPAVVLAGD